MQQIQTLKQAHEALNGLMRAIIAVVYQLIYTLSPPPSSPRWRWMHFHPVHGFSSDCLTITALHNGSHPILDAFKTTPCFKSTIQINAIKINVINYPGILRGCSQTLVNGGEPTDPSWVFKRCWKGWNITPMQFRTRADYRPRLQTLWSQKCARPDDGRAVRSSQNRHMIRLWTLEFSILIGNPPPV